MRVAMVGSRTKSWVEADIDPFIAKVGVWQWMKRHLDPRQDMLVSGGAGGVDTWAEDQAKEMEVARHIIPAQWKIHGKRAGFIRNPAIVDASNVVVAHWAGVGGGTLNTMSHAIHMMRPLLLRMYEDGEWTETWYLDAWIPGEELSLMAMVERFTDDDTTPSMPDVWR